MRVNVRLPSGAVAPLEAPGLTSLLSGGGATEALARATLAHEEVDASALLPEDVYAVARWGLRAFAMAAEAGEFIAVCMAFSQAPSARLAIADPTLAWDFDSCCCGALADEPAQQAAAEAPKGAADGVITYSVPDTWTGDDDA